MTRSMQSLEAEYREKTSKSRAQWERGKSSMPGGVIKGAYLDSPYPHYVERAEGCYVWDIDGNRFVDLSGAFGVANAGHAHPEIVANPIIEQVAQAVANDLGINVVTLYTGSLSESDGPAATYHASFAGFLHKTKLSI